MIETPAAALQAADIAPEVAFFSVGTNDLVQYTLAADRGNERLRHLQRSVVAQQHTHPVLQTFFGNQALHMHVLVVRQRDAGGVHAVVLGGPQQQPAPARADVQKTLARLQPQLAADVLQLGLLRLRQCHLRVLVIGARIHAPWIEPQRVKIV